MQESKQNSTHTGMSAAMLARLERMRLMDDAFFSEALKGQTDAVQYILDTVLERTDLKVIEVESQYEYSSAVSRAIRLDIRATDADGRLADIEVQRADEPDLILRARYYAAMIDSRMLPKGAQFHTLAQRFVIFITESDPLGKGCPLYHIHNVIDELGGTDAGDGAMTVLVNGTFRDALHPVGRLMHDFYCTKADDIFSPVLARQVRYMKETEGGRTIMCRIMEEVHAEGRAEGRAENTREIMDNMIAAGLLSDAEIALYTGTTPEQVAARRRSVSA